MLGRRLPARSERVRSMPRALLAHLAGSGEVVGIVNMVFVKGTKETALSATSGSTYAVPVQPLLTLLERLK